MEEHGAFRHRNAELCSIGALALLFYVHFHVLRKPVPQFAPDFTDPDFGEYGRRSWYENHVFPSSEGDTISMSYQSKLAVFVMSDSALTCFVDHHKRIKIIHAKNDIHITKATHAGRSYAAKQAREFGASVDAVKALGNWSDSDTYRACYDRALAKEALFGAACFDAKRPESHCLARASLGQFQYQTI